MKSNYFLFLFVLFTFVGSFGQCAFTGLASPQVGTVNIFCVDNGNTITTPTVNAGKYVLVNVIQGFNYTFSVGNVFTAGSDNENITLFNAANANLGAAGFSSAATGTSLTWTATLSGTIKVQLSHGACLNDNATGGALTLTLNTVGNTFDSQATFGTDQWIGHVYNFTGGIPPGGASPAAPATTTPFSNAQYVGYYPVTTETINEGFGGSNACFPLLSNGIANTNIYTEQYAVRYRMRSTKTGCYLVTIAGDDGVRLYVDGVLVANQWQDQGTTTYSNILVYLNGSSNLILDYYENGGGNQVNFSLTPFLASSNTFTANSTSVCSGIAPVFDGSNYSYNGGTINPTISFQWQVSSDNAIFTDIAGATLEDYTPPAISTFVNITKYYRRVVKAVSNAGSCTFNSPSIGVTTNAESVSGPCFPLSAAVNTFCIDNTNTIVTPTVNAGSYVNLNVVKGFTYTFSVGDVFSGANENITILDSSTNSNVTPSSITSGATGVSVTWVSSLSGAVKLVLTKGAFISDGSTGGPMTLVLNSVGNTQDSQTAFGTDNWVGHVYNWTGGAPPGGNASPNPIAFGTPFSNAEYVGYYNVPTQNFNEGFGGNNVCFPVLTNGVNRTNVYTDKFAVRYRMRTTLSGCFLASFDGDDGVRIYVDGVLVFSEWKEQSPTNYGNILLTLTGNNDIVIDYYENGGQNVVNFSMVPFAATTNTIAGPANISVCTGNSPGVLDGSSYTYTGGTVNPTILYQWQSSPDGVTFTDISGATLEDYTPPTQTTTTTNIVIYYRRKVTAAIPSSCVFFSDPVKITTSPVSVLANPTVSGPNSICPTSKQVYSCTAVTNASNYNWVVPTGWILVSGAGTTSITVTSGTSAQSGNVTVTATNGCGTSGTVSYAVAITSAVTWNGVSFSASPNNINRPIIFNGNYTSPANTTIAACDCTVNGSSIVTITSGSTMTLQNDIKVNAAATMTFANNAPLVQQNDVPNTGNIRVQRNSSALMRLDYTLWSSPVIPQNILAFSPLTYNVGPSNIRFYTYNTTANFYSTINPGTTNFAYGKGYLIRMPDNHPTTPTVWNGQFTGVPNNGTNTTPISYVSATQKYNTVGNPYASPISMSSFVTANSANITGTLRFWRKTNSVTTNTGYSTWNGGIFVAGPNFSASSDPLGIIQTGQGFMVEAKPSATSVRFDNTMRVANTANQFFKTSNANVVDEVNFMWLNLIGDNEQFSQIALGYRSNASDNVDEFDAVRIDGQTTLSSLINSSTSDYVIQSRAVPFNSNDSVPLSIKISTPGNYSIILDHTSGLFNGIQDVYLKDNLTNVVTNLTTSNSYNFTSNSGVTSNRFEIIYQNSILSNSSNEFNTNGIIVYKNNSDIVVNSVNTEIENIKVFDITGRLLFNKSNVNKLEYRFNLGATNEVVIVKTTLVDGKVITKKIIN